jgi:dihydroorotase
MIAMGDLLIKGARVLDPTNGADSKADVLVKAGLIADIGPSLPDLPGVAVIHAYGLTLTAGFIDLHCHLRDPGFEYKETISTGAMAAAKGGFSTVCCMPNTVPAIDCKAVADYVNERAGADSVVNVMPIACVTRGRKGQELVDMSELAGAGVVGFSDDGDPVASSRMMRCALEYTRPLKAVIMDHCEDKALTEGASMHEGWVSARLGLKGMPSAAEDIIVARDLALAALVGGRIHICHVSTSSAADLIRRAKDKGVNVTCECTPHHLCLTEEWVIGGKTLLEGVSPLVSRGPFDTNAKTNPPLRSKSDVEALITALRDGTIDAIATDHAPHAEADKVCEFGEAAFGIIGFETAFGSLMSLVHSGRLELSTLIARMTSGPANVIGHRLGRRGFLRAGMAADITLCDLDRDWTVDPLEFASKGRNTPLAGLILKGKIMATIVSGCIAYRDPSVKMVTGD